MSTILYLSRITLRSGSRDARYWSKSRIRFSYCSRLQSWWTISGGWSTNLRRPFTSAVSFGKTYSATRFRAFASIASRYRRAFFEGAVSRSRSPVRRVYQTSRARMVARCAMYSR